MADLTVGDAIDAAATQYGLNPTVLKGIAHIESSWDPRSNINKNTQYKGLFQIGRDEWKQHGSGDIYNAQDNANAAARLLSSHSQWFQNNYGREPTPGELYMMHLQGRGFISNGTMTNVAGNPYPGMQGPQTPESFQKGWSDTLARKMALYGGGDPGAASVAASTPLPTGGAVSPMAGLLAKLGIGSASATPPMVPAAGPTPSGATLDAVAATQQQGENQGKPGDARAKALGALAQQLMIAGQAPKANFMQLQPMNTGPMRALPIDLPPMPKGFGTTFGNG